MEEGSVFQPNQPGVYRKYRDVGKFAIFYHQNVNDQSPLPGAKVDAINLQIAAQSLGFDADKPYSDLNYAKMFQLLDSYAEMDHTNSNCFAMAIMTHGGDNDTMATSDGIEYNLFQVLDKFREKNSPTLKGKPKMFFINTCRGELKDPGAPRTFGGASIGSTTKILTVPVEKDFLVVHTTCPEYMATVWKDIGSPFIQSLCTVLQNKELHDIIDVLTLVSNNASEESCQRETPQMPSFTSQLTASFHLHDPSDTRQPTAEQFYVMENPNRGHFFIFSNERDDDVVKLEESGENLGFVVKHCGLNEMMDTGIKYVNGRYTDHDCLVCVIKTCSKDHDELYVGDNQTRYLKHFIELFHANQCPAMHGKPKIFIVQAPYNGVTMGTGSTNATHTIPETADTLIVYSTSPEESRSYGNGTMFIEELCQNLQPSPTGLDLYKVFTLVTEQMSGVVGLHVPSVTSQLRKKVVFF